MRRSSKVFFNIIFCLSIAFILGGKAYEKYLEHEIRSTLTMKKDILGSSFYVKNASIRDVSVSLLQRKIDISGFHLSLQDSFSGIIDISFDSAVVQGVNLFALSDTTVTSLLDSLRVKEVKILYNDLSQPISKIFELRLAELKAGEIHGSLGRFLSQLEEKSTISIIGNTLASFAIKSFDVEKLYLKNTITEELPNALSVGFFSLKNVTITGGNDLFVKDFFEKFSTHSVSLDEIQSNLLQFAIFWQAQGVPFASSPLEIKNLRFKKGQVRNANDVLYSVDESKIDLHVTFVGATLVCSLSNFLIDGKNLKFPFNSFNFDGKLNIHLEPLTMKNLSFTTDKILLYNKDNDFLEASFSGIYPLERFSNIYNFSLEDDILFKNISFQMSPSVAQYFFATYELWKKNTINKKGYNFLLQKVFEKLFDTNYSDTVKKADIEKKIINIKVIFQTPMTINSLLQEKEKGDVAVQMIVSSGENTLEKK